MHIGESNNFFIRMKPENITSTVESIKKTYNSFKPDIPMDFHFLDDDFDKLYRSEQRMSKILGLFLFPGNHYFMSRAYRIIIIYDSAKNKRDRHKENKRSKIP